MNEIKKGVGLDALLSLRKGSRAMAEDKNKYILSINGTILTHKSHDRSGFDIQVDMFQNLIPAE